jgi:hypothetical protein
MGCFSEIATYECQKVVEPKHRFSVGFDAL